MNIAAIVHYGKSRFAYAYNEDTLHIRIRTAKNDVEKIILKSADPFNWIQDDKGEYRYDISSVKSVEMRKEGEGRYCDYWFGEIRNVTSRRVRYAFFLTGKEKESIMYGCNQIIDLKQEREPDNVFNYFDFPYMNEEDIYKAPDWVKDAVWYQLTVNCYSHDGGQADDTLNGNFDGLIRKLDYIADMGYTALYLTPIFEAYSWHKYDTTDYFNVDKAFGGNGKFREFVEAAHKKGIKVMLDAVFNHCGPLHKFWQDVIRNGRKSPYYDCFYILDEKEPVISGKIRDDGSYEECTASGQLNFRTFGHTPYMPKINTGNAIWRQYLLEAARKWTQEYKIDGWRLDVSNEVSHDFWRTFRKVVKEINPDVYIMGENWDDAYEWLRGDQFDSVMNYGFLNAVWGFLCPEDSSWGNVASTHLTASGYRYEIDTLIGRYPRNVTEHLFNLVSSHDVDRLLTVMGEEPELVKLAYVLSMTYSGAPSVYYGDEIGMSGRGSGSRAPMIWDQSRQNLDLQEAVRKLIRLRKQNPVMKAVDITWELIEDDKSVILFSKEQNQDKIYVAVNASADSQEILLPDGLRNRKLRDLYRQEEILLKERLTMAPYEFYILQ